ncbi:hypothetical protein THMIRHAT_06870 [Thiosulfativibrio zosterae]|uniref:GGDEF-domain containing protein n=2 Tax=Thiosulfativibrio zosterae TaxID=2675053 RepID=A0A6F8PLF7_9GAMM|nr:hypothetical protein THMIRHAT_06870 [Thiosulfativibrio zosterae]
MHAKFYLMFFLILTLGLYIGFNIKLYKDAEEIRQQTQQRTEELAQIELTNAIDAAIAISRSKIKEMALWEEVQQQLNEPSYYFFWHDERLKESQYWEKYYDQLELYNKDRKPLHAIHHSDEHMNALPNEVPSADKNTFFLNQQGHLDLVMFEPIYNSTTQKLEGYIGLTLDFLPLILQNYQFTYLDKSSIQIAKTHNIVTVEMDQIESQMIFEPVKNPVNDYLWTLIQNFINQVIIFGILLAGLFTIFFKLSTLNPLNSLVNYLTQLKNNPSSIIPPENKRFCFLEFEELKNSLSGYNQQLINAQVEIEAQRETALCQSRIDALSNILNRRAFDTRLDTIFLHYHEAQHPVGFILFDCDFFKAINDTYGHEIGDSVIRITASTFRNALPESVEIYRIGGDEFACIVEHQDLAGVLDIANLCFNAIRNYDFNHIGIREKIAYSVGISFIDSHNSEDLALMHKQADIALYKSKRSLHQKVQVFQKDDEHAGKTLTSNEHITAIVESLHSGKNIRMHLQPVYGIHNQIDYFESLIRIQFDNKLIHPVEIFDVVNHRHLETELDKQVINQILHYLDAGKIQANTGVSINISASTLLNEDLMPLFAPLEAHLTHQKITIEIIEDTLISHLELATQKLSALREKGFKIALDDFGSGYSSIRYLAHMPVDIIKFDMSLTHALLQDKKTHQIIMTTAQMITHAGYQLVLEGIETDAHLTAAKAAGATHFQGYLLGRPQDPYSA